jgi:hypothetical protein
VREELTCRKGAQTVAVRFERRGALTQGTDLSLEWETGEKVSVEGSTVEARWGFAGLDEVAEDSEELLRTGNDGEDPHRGTAAGTEQGALAVCCANSCRL